MMKNTSAKPAPFNHLKTTSLFSACIITCCGIFQSLHAEANIYSTDFESFSPNQALTQTPISGWTGNDNGSTTIVSISDKDSRSQTKSLYQRDQNPKGIPTATYDFGQTCTNVVVSLAIKLNTTLRIEVCGPDGSVNFVLVHENYAPAKGPAWELRDAKGTVLNFVADNTIGYKTGEWNTISITFNEANKSFNLSVNGTSAITGTGGVLDAVDWNMRLIRLMTGWYSGEGETLYNYFDDLSVKKVAP